VYQVTPHHTTPATRQKSQKCCISIQYIKPLLPGESIQFLKSNQPAQISSRSEALSQNDQRNLPSQENGKFKRIQLEGVCQRTSQAKEFNGQQHRKDQVRFISITYVMCIFTKSLSRIRNISQVALRNISQRFEQKKLQCFLANLLPFQKIRLISQTGTQ